MENKRKKLERIVKTRTVVLRLGKPEWFEFRTVVVKAKRER